MGPGLLGLSILASACGSDGIGLQAPEDLGVVIVADAGAAPEDAQAPPLDAGRVSAPDAAPLPDAEEAPLPDAGEAQDAGVVAPTDAGAVLSDAGTSTAIATRCFAQIYDPNIPGPNYDQFHPVVGSHCFGTNHQDIQGVERVVFLGDSVTVGTPPTVSNEYYRNLLADQLVQKFNLESPSTLWRTVNLIDGISYRQLDRDFGNCSKWGARTDDLLGTNNQLETCFPPETLGKRTLIIMTMGGNDIAHITKEGGLSHMPVRTRAELQQQTEQFVTYLRQSMEWIKTPGRFPNGVFVIFANPPEFTDGTGDVESCGLSSVAGFDDPWPNPQDLKDLVIWALEQYMAIAVDTHTDLLWFLESFCGHGYVATGPHADPSNRCYRGPNTERWFDLTCIHPNPTGHHQLADMFMAVVNE
ncbi:MAG: GDSL-type esterase/lipase family protein [Myxococcota bacterium]